MLIDIISSCGRADQELEARVEDLCQSGPDSDENVPVDPKLAAAGRSDSVEPRAILVGMPGGYKELWPQQEALYKQFDWAALKKMVGR